MSRFSSWGTGGWAWTCFSITSIGVVPVKGSCPVNMWKQRMPNA